MLLRLQIYDLDVSCTPGKDLVAAYTLSRSNVKSIDRDKDTSEVITHHVDMVISSMPVSDRRLEEIREETANDPELKSLASVILHGWPTAKADCKPEVAPYFKVREQLSTADGLVLKGTCIVISSSMRKTVLQKGIKKCRRRARAHVYWPNINAEITELVTNCTDCQAHSNKNIARPLQPREVPNRPWQKIGVHLFSYKGKKYLTLVDYTSGFPELIEMNFTTSKAVLTTTQSVFARFGPPAAVMNDKVPQFSSEEVC